MKGTKIWTLSVFFMSGLFLNESRLLEGVQGLLGNIRSMLTSEPKLVSMTTPSFGCSRGYHLDSDGGGCSESVYVQQASECVLTFSCRQDSVCPSLSSQLFVLLGLSPGRGRVSCVLREPIRMKRGGTSATSVLEGLHPPEHRLSVNVSQTGSKKKYQKTM